ncbi:MAG: molybdopterin adenylyltransferase [Bradymonadaceae bacterium]
MSDEVLDIGIVTCSDRAARGEYEDEGGPALYDWLDRALESDWNAHRRVVADDREAIAETLRKLVDEVGCHLVMTTGGTGPTPGDVTPEATRDVADKVLPGFGERMREISLQYVPTAILSRQIGAVRDRTLLINLPGNPQAIDQILDELFEAVPAAIHLLGGPAAETDPDVVEAFWPGHDH